MQVRTNEKDPGKDGLFYHVKERRKEGRLSGKAVDCNIVLKKNVVKVGKNSSKQIHLSEKFHIP